jgi:hypothetical protein
MKKETNANLLMVEKLLKLNGKKDFNTTIKKENCKIIVTSENSCHLQTLLACVISLKNVYLENFNETSFAIRVYK